MHALFRPINTVTRSDALPVPGVAQGLWLSRLMSLFGDKEARILVLGLDNAGKTTILCEYERGVID